MFTHALQIRSSQRGELCMIGPTWSPCSRFAPFYETGRPSYLYMLNAQLETVMTFQSDQCTHPHKYLTFESAGQVAVELTVRSPGARAPGVDGHSGH